MAHAAARRCCRSGDKSGDRFFAVFLDPLGGFLLGGAADLADHDDAARVGVVVEELDDVEVRAAGDGIAADADAGRLAKAVAGELPHRLVGERAAAADDADVARLVDVAGGDADAAAAVGILACAGGDDAGAVRADEPGCRSVDRGLDFNHVAHGDALGDGDDQLEPGIDCLEDGVGGEGRRNKNRGGGGAGFFDSLGDAVENRDGVLEFLAGFSGGDAGDNLGAVLEAEL